MIYKAFISYSHAADFQLAPKLQSALQRFAKPFYRLRKIRIFRDETNLSLTPQLWGTIQKAIGDSENFIFLASPQAAESDWVRQEIEEWLRLQKGKLDNLMVVLTEGEIVWDKNRNDFDWEKTTALPEIFRGKYCEEPFYLDFRWVKTSTELSLRNPRFLRDVGRIAAKLNGKDLDEFIGEDVRQHRIFKFVTGATIIVLLMLLAASSFAAYYASIQADIAVAQTIEANRQKDEAEKQTRIAEEKTAEANRQTLLTRQSADNERIARENEKTF